MKAIALFAGIFFAVAHFGMAASDPSLTRLEQQIELLAHTTDAVVGVSAIHIESGRTVSVRGTESFPQASAVKVPIAVQVMALADEGKLSLDEMVSLKPADLHPGSGKISELLFHPGVALSLENIMELAIVVSDNSAADLMLREAGGPAAVTARMKGLGLGRIRVDRSIAQLLADWGGVKSLPPEAEWTRNMWDNLFDAVPQAEHMAARRLQTRDVRDTATPDNMAGLLVHIWKRDLFSQVYATKLWEVMERCETGKTRIKGMLPEGTNVAHKTGSMGGVVNDVGVITLPGRGGHVALAVFTKGSNRPEEVSEKTVAEISRTVYDYFTLVPGGSGGGGGSAVGGGSEVGVVRGGGRGAVGDGSDVGVVRGGGGTAVGGGSDVGVMRGSGGSAVGGGSEVGVVRRGVGGAVGSGADVGVVGSGGGSAVRSGSDVGVMRGSGGSAVGGGSEVGVVRRGVGGAVGTGADVGVVGSGGGSTVRSGADVGVVRSGVESAVGGGDDGGVVMGGGGSVVGSGAVGSGAGGGGAESGADGGGGGAVPVVAAGSGSVEAPR